jgi:hypothetical protein
MLTDVNMKSTLLTSVLTGYVTTNFHCINSVCKVLQCLARTEVQVLLVIIGPHGRRNIWPITTITDCIHTGVKKAILTKLTDYSTQATYCICTIFKYVTNETVWLLFQHENITTLWELTRKNKKIAFTANLRWEHFKCHQFWTLEKYQCTDLPQIMNTDTLAGDSITFIWQQFSKQYPIFRRLPGYDSWNTLN